MPTEPAAHVALLAEIVKGATGEGLRFNLTTSSLQDGQDGIELWVDEGQYRYPLAHDAAGWGAVMSEAKCARVCIHKVIGATGQRVQLGEAEVRVDKARPQYNAEQLVRAAGALLRQGVLDRSGEAIIMRPEIHAPRPAIGARLLQFQRRAFSSLRARLWPERSQWTIGLLPAAAARRGCDFPWREVKWIIPPNDQFIADPFLVECDGTLWLFYERLLFEENKGTLWAARLDPRTGALSEGAEILRMPFHLSFPNVFRDAGQWYLLPEQARSGKTTLYRAVDFPHRWEAWRDLLPTFPGIDPVLHLHGGRWWLFASHGAHPCTENNLYLFSSESLGGEFLPHRMNPIRSGLRGSRMAGQILVEGQRMIRPGQDGRSGYGMGVVLQEIRKLDVDHYDESEICLWPPERGGRFSEGFHTYMVCHEWLVIDGKRTLPSR